MLGWEVFAFRNSSAKRDDLVVHWMTSVFGLDWLDQLVKYGKANDLGGNGYPNRYKVPANVLIPFLSNGLPANRSPLVIGDDYVLPEGWEGEIVRRQDPATCGSNDTLFLEVWDQS
jgi:hypothetical protein